MVSWSRLSIGYYSVLKIDCPSAEEWTGWPDGDWIKEYTTDEWMCTGRFRVHWATYTQGGSRTGSKEADSPGEGRPSTRVCLGVIKCVNPDRDPVRGCTRMIRPKTRDDETRDNQLQQLCKCGYQLELNPCSARMVTIQWHDGVVFHHIGHHLHDRPSHQPRVMPHDFQKLKDRVLNAPSKVPLALAVEMAADSSTPNAYKNLDQICKDRGGILQEAGLSRQGHQADMQEFTDFDAKHGGIIQLKQFGNITVISLQSQGMRDLLMEEGCDSSSSPMAGTVTDGAHKFFKEKNTQLLSTSAYSHTTESWGPVLLSATNGNTAEHYALHYGVLFQSIAEERERQSEPFNEWDLGQVSGPITVSLAFNLFPFLRLLILVRLKPKVSKWHSSTLCSHEKIQECWTSYQKQLRH